MNENKMGCIQAIGLVAAAAMELYIQEKDGISSWSSWQPINEIPGVILSTGHAPESLGTLNIPNPRDVDRYQRDYYANTIVPVVRAIFNHASAYHDANHIISVACVGERYLVFRTFAS